MLKEEGDSAAITLTPTAAGATWTSWCESCHSVPCSVYCRADAAYLCRGCDASIHTANSLASRHQRFAVLPAPAGGFIVEGIPAARREFRNLSEEEEEEDGLLIGGEVDEYLDLVEFRSCEEEGMKIEEKEKNEGREVDGLVPVQCFVGQEEQQILHTLQMDYEGFKGGIHYSTAASLALDVSQSSIEQTGVPENTMMSISNSQIRTSKGTIELFSSPPLQMPHQFIPLDREARVLRYREKRKNRKFQKIIRYASRKAYAERRPRIKGRFAKRTDKELEVDQMFAAPVMVETGYGVVPSY